jgi:formate/nitrite transporter FocA (FNT family)
VFVALFWAAAVGLGAMLMDAAAPDLVQAAVFPLGLLFAVLFAGYLFLFFFFLGETLGGRLLSRRDAA